MTSSDWWMHVRCMTCVSLSLSLIRHWASHIVMLFLPVKMFIGQGFQPLAPGAIHDLGGLDRLRSWIVHYFGHKIVRMLGIFRTFWSTWIPGVCPIDMSRTCGPSSNFGWDFTFGNPVICMLVQGLEPLRAVPNERWIKKSETPRLRLLVESDRRGEYKIFIPTMQITCNGSGFLIGCNLMSILSWWNRVIVQLCYALLWFAMDSCAVHLVLC